MKDGIMTHDEIRSMLRLYTGKPCTYLNKNPKSRVIRKWDILMLCGLHRERTEVRNFLRGKYKFGKKVTERLSRIITLIQQGRITKTQYGVYHFHDEPVVAEIKKTMSISIGKSGLSISNSSPIKEEKRFPNFNHVFGGK